jgi:hypothetical protein
MAISERSALRTTAALLTGVGTFQACLALGAPWGRIAYGGQHHGRLPMAYRRVSGGATLVYLATAGFIALEAGSPRARRSVLSTVTGVMTLSSALNLASRSSAERMVWTPVCAATAVLAWRSRPR